MLEFITSLVKDTLDVMLCYVSKGCIYMKPKLYES